MEEIKTAAVILVGFGSPADPSKVRPFLYQIFSDPVASPFVNFGPLMKPAAFILANIAENATKERYESISGKPSSLELITGLAERLRHHLIRSRGQEIEVVPAMRYGEPSLTEAIETLSKEGHKKILVLPLFPHSAVATTGSIEAVVNLEKRKNSLNSTQIEVAGHWHDEPEFVAAWGESIRMALAGFPAGVRDSVHLLFSAHAIPTRHVDALGDDYTAQIAESASVIAGSFEAPLNMSIAYQSPATFGSWTTPNLEDELSRLRESGVRNCIIVPISFIYDNTETWFDIDLELIPYAADLGFTRIRRATPPLNSPHILSALADIIK